MIGKLLSARSWRSGGAIGLLVAAALVWAYEPAIYEMMHRWMHDPQYTHGFLVPFFACFLLWHRRDRLIGHSLRATGWGFLVVLAGVVLRLAGAYLYNDWLVGLSLLPTLAGLAMLWGSWPVLRWAWPAIAFLFFMVPLPFRLHAALGGPLQHIATVASTYALQTLGFPAVSEGNVIQIDQTRIGVVEACSGLSMLLTFFALSTAVILLMERPLIDRLVVLVSAVPVAVACNIVRITVTGLLHELAGQRVADLVFHDLAGWLMMPLGVTILLGELSLMQRLLIENRPDAPVPLPQPAPTRKARTVGGRRVTKRPGLVRAHRQLPLPDLPVSETGTDSNQCTQVKSHAIIP